MAKLDSNIYGADDTEYASAIASDALDPGGKEDYWGATIDQDAVAKGNTPNLEDNDVKIVTSTGTQKPATSKGNH